MYNTGWAKTRRTLDCVFIVMNEISGRYGQILDRSGKKIIILSPLREAYVWRNHVATLLPHCTRLSEMGPVTVHFSHRHVSNNLLQS